MDCKNISGNDVDPDFKYGMHSPGNETKGENRATRRVKVTLLNYLFLIHPFSTPENIRKPHVFRVFIGNKWVKET